MMPFFDAKPPFLVSSAIKRQNQKYFTSFFRLRAHALPPPYDAYIYMKLAPVNFPQCFRLPKKI